MNKSRREFIKKSAISTVGLTIGGLGFSAKSYARILGANDRINFGIVGINSRGRTLLQALTEVPNSVIAYVCDVDSRVIDASKKMVSELTNNKAKGIVDFRELIQKKDLDAIAIATPEHWHAPMGIWGMQAGKHVYIEKPCSHNPKEGELLVKVQKKTGKVAQMGNQQRSSDLSIKAIKEIRENDIIGTPYFGKAWYSNKRGSIGTGKVVEVPEWLNWELWQGPAPRKEYKDNYVHYNWHWFKHYGTGEIHNNGTHEIDICRWALGVDYPVKVNSGGGRYHFNDDWEFTDTQVVNYEFAENKLITWEGKSCNNMPYHGAGRGATIHGTKGSAYIDRNSYIFYDLDNKVIKEEKLEKENSTTDTRGKADQLTVAHVTNFANAIRKGEKLNSPIQDAAVSTLLCHLGNISQQMGKTLSIDNKSGRVINDEEAMKLWQRQYEPGWEIKV